MTMLTWIAFDADDTLWENERLYHRGRERFHAILAKYKIAADIDPLLDETEIHNLRYYGYGVMSFILSLIETAIQATGGKISAEDVQALLELGKEMLTAKVSLLDGVHETLAKLSESHPLMLITKGDLFHQRRKVEASGLGSYFQAIEIVSEKKPQDYAEILARHKIDAEKFLMVGNSLRSDIRPILELGGWAIHIPNHLNWAHEEAEIPENLQDRFITVDKMGKIREVIEELANLRL
ncbi:MAG: hypothetical protein MAG431_00112 [Chloroflexi bacterium]|nr:hypothetical protein [Chloroflexota bacterium]